VTSPVESPGARPGSRSPRGSRRGKRGLENNFHTSIDFASPDGMNCPQIVRAAQAGSIVEVESLLDNMVDIEACHASSGRNAMAVAAHCGNDEVVELLLRYRAKLTQRDASGSTPMHLAASRGHLGVMNVLLNEQVSIEEKGPADKTPLRLSCDNGEFEAAELLLLKRAKVNARDKNNLTSLHAASKRGDVDIVDLLIKYGAHIEAKDGQFMAALHYACEGGHDAVVDLLLDKKAEIEVAGRDGKTPLISAASEGHVHVLELLLRRKASMKKRSAGEMSALHWAAFNGHVEAVDALLQRKAPINAANADGRTALHLAVMAEKFDVVELLLRKNAAIEVQCRSALRPLHYACSFENIDIVRLLLHSGANTEAEALDRRRPLHLAAKRGVLPTVTMLVEQGCNMEARDAAGDRPLLLASSAGHTEVVRKLLDSGAPLRSKFTTGPSHEDSPLCVAARNGHLEVVTLLINRGTSVRHKDEYDWHPLRYAAHYGHPEVVDRLLLYGASVTGNQSWGFGLTAERIGFAENIYIPEERRDEVLRLLREAEDRERMSQERLATTRQTPSAASHLAAVPQAEASELDHGMDIQRPPPRELFSPDNTRYSQPRQEIHTTQQPSRRPSDRQPPGVDGLVSVPSNDVSQGPYGRFSFQTDSQDRSHSTVSALSPDPSRGYSAVSAISPGPSPEPNASSSSTPRPFSYVPTPVLSTPISTEVGQETPNPSATYRDTLRTWSSTIPPPSRRAPEGPPAAFNQGDGSERRPLPNAQTNPQTENAVESHSPRPTTPSRPAPPQTAPPSPTNADTITVEGLELKVKRRRELGLTTFSAPGDIVWDLSDLEMMIEGYRAAGIGVLGRAQDGFPPHEGLGDGDGTGLESEGGSDVFPGGFRGARSPIPRHAGPPPHGADFHGTEGVDRFARSPAGVFEMG
jgi:ankyrin repeat protein